MGTYDTVHYNCPSCHAPLDYQSKAGPCDLKVYPVSCVPLSIAGAMLTAAVKCPHCGTEIEFDSPRHHVLVVPRVKREN